MTEAFESTSASEDHCRLDRLCRLPLLPLEFLEYALWKSVSESSVVMAPGIPGVIGVTGDVDPSPFKDATEGTLRGTCTTSSDDPVGVLFPGSDGIVGMCCSGIFGEATSSSGCRAGVVWPLRLVCAEDVVLLLLLDKGGLLTSFVPFTGRGRTGKTSERSSASLSWLST